ncbi:hypothetical protein KKC45_01340 [Patescibacteria group bacterium]|nr:hypothetical protein [Patescibacteria group bacterium]
MSETDLFGFFHRKGWRIVMFEGSEFNLYDLSHQEVKEFAEKTLREDNSLSSEEKSLLGQLILEEKNKRRAIVKTKGTEVLVL